MIDAKEVRSRKVRHSFCITKKIISVSYRLHTIWINLFLKFKIFVPALQADRKKLVIFGGHRSNTKDSISLPLRQVPNT